MVFRVIFDLCASNSEKLHHASIVGGFLYQWMWHYSFSVPIKVTSVYYSIYSHDLVENESVGSKIVFTNGSQDPWRHASKQTSSPDSKYSITSMRSHIKIFEFCYCIICITKNEFPVNTLMLDTLENYRLCHRIFCGLSVLKFKLLF